MNTAKQEELLVCAASGDSKGVANILRLSFIFRVNVNYQNKDGVTALILAARNGHTDIARLLIDHGAALDLKNYIIPNWQVSSYQDAESGFAPTVEQMESESAQWDREKKADGTTALMISAQYGHTDIVKLLIDKGADLNLQGRGDRGSSLAHTKITALLGASANGHTDIVRLLIDKGVELDFKNGRELIVAAENGHIDIVKLFIEMGVDPGLGNGGALRFASGNGHAGVVRLLVDSGAKLDFQGSDGRTALIAAAENGHADIVKLFMDKGADLNLEAGESCFFIKRTALGFAIARKRREVVLLLGPAMVKARDTEEPVPLRSLSREERFVVCAALGELAEIAEMIRQGVDINYQKADGATALMRASFKGHFYIVQLLVEKGAHLDLWDRNHCTALMMASEKGHVGIVKLLIDRGANLDFMGECLDPGDFEMRLYKALDFARKVGKNNEVIRLLEQAGAKGFLDI